MELNSHILDNKHDSIKLPKTLDDYLKKIPTDIGKVIFSFLIPDSKNINFKKYGTNRHRYSSYSTKYEKAFIGNGVFRKLPISGEIVKNKEGLYLSRICKKNGKYRYYITEEVIDTIHVEYGDREMPIHYYDYFSKYVGKNIDIALIELLF